jgi:hypothetical protein
MKRVMLLITLAALALSGNALANTSSAIFAYTPGIGTPGTLVLDGNAVTANFTGWYDETGSHSAFNPNYIAGVCGSSDACNGNDLDQHDFFVFSIPSGTYTSAVLQIYNPGVAAGDANDGYICPCGSLTYTNWDVLTAIADLEASNSGRIDIYNDLGSGVQFGSVTVTAASDGTFVNITLDAAALAAINAAAGGEFAIGGAVGMGTTTPEPGTLVLLGTAMLTGAGLIRRKLML